MIDDLLRQLEASGRVDSEGCFTLDRAKAREKLQRFQLADPRAYVLELVQAAALKGARRARFDIDSRDMVMEFDGRPFTVEDFDDVYAAALRHSLEPDLLARRQLALGLGSAMALGPTAIEVESGDGTTGARLQLGPRGDDAFEAMQTARVGTRIHVRERFGLQTLGAFVRNLRGALAEERLLRERCVYATMAIDLEGRWLSGGLRLREAVCDEIKLTHGPTTLVCGLRMDGQGVPVVHLVKDGVWIVSHELPEVRCPVGFVAVVQDHALRKEVSQTDIVRDAAYVAMTKVLWRGAAHAVAALAYRQGTGAAPVWAEDVLLSLMQHLAELEVNWHEDEPTGRMKALRALPLWETTKGQRVSLLQVLAELEARGRVVFTLRQPPDGEPLPGTSFILRFLAGDPKHAVRREILQWILRTRLCNVDVVLQRRATWRARPTAPVLPEGVYLARHAFEAPGVRGEVGIVAEPKADAIVTLVVEGCVLSQLHLSLPWPGLRMIVAADAFRPSADYDRLARSVESSLALLHAVAAIPEAYAGLARAPQSAWRDTCARSFCRTLLQRASLLVLWPTARDRPSPMMQQAIAAFGAKRLRLDPGLDEGRTPHPVLGMPLWPTLGPRPVSVLQIRLHDAWGESVQFVVPGIIGTASTDVLVLDEDDRALLQGWLSRPAVNVSSGYRARRAVTADVHARVEPKVLQAQTLEFLEARQSSVDAVEPVSTSVHSGGSSEAEVEAAEAAEAVEAEVDLEEGEEVEAEVELEEDEVEAEVEAEVEDVEETEVVPEAVPEPSPEERLVEVLRAELGRVRERDDTLLCDEHLERIRVAPLTRKRRALVAWAGHEGVIVNREHPLVALVLSEPHGDPVWRDYLCAAIYTAINVWLEEITDADEQRFLVHWARHAALR
ncbi:hypothetical protein [Paraliomyxa miuraensis]|uniref:hypothetical protein n=1 Tax=Paraliomyxa miuraensis TaxID=376150 RepID=UPI00224DAA12|nr:hypothetical protein [Paraliomyxa miuraensis]MCX4242405.1 hypothetical protein [Paraliomyxa miuraensis]